jgi:hypothetical protein
VNRRRRYKAKRRRAFAAWLERERIASGMTPGEWEEFRESGLPFVLDAIREYVDFLNAARRETSGHS